MKIVNKIVSALCALAMVSSVLGMTSFAAVNSAEKPLDIYVEEAAFDASKGILTLNVKYDNFAEAMGTSVLAIGVEVSDYAAITKASFSKVNSDVDAVTSYTQKDAVKGTGSLYMTITSLAGNLINDYTSASGIYYTIKCKLAADYYDATSIIKPLTFKVYFVNAEVGEREYDADFEKWSYDSTKASVICYNNPAAGGTIGVTSSKDLVYGKETPEESSWVDATHYKDYTSTIDDSKAAAYTVEFTGDGNTYDKMTWKVVSGETTKGCHVDAAIGGEGTFKLGIAIGGLTSADITSVQAATGAQGTVAQ